MYLQRLGATPPLRRHWFSTMQSHRSSSRLLLTLQQQQSQERKMQRVVALTVRTLEVMVNVLQQQTKTVR